MHNGISQICGQALCADMSQATAYRALRPLICSQCGAEIGAGDVFTRWPISSKDRFPIMPKCKRCVPFNLINERAQARTDNLIDALLHNDERDVTEEENEAREKVYQEMQRRLGPALMRSRRFR